MPVLPPVEHAAETLPTEDLPPLSFLTEGWWILLITILTALPWAIVAVWDAIDGEYRPRSEVAIRLFISSVCLVVAYTAGILFCAVLTRDLISGKVTDRHDEVATVLVLLIFNIWHVLRNFLGWSQFLAIRKITYVFHHLQKNFAVSFDQSVGYNLDDDIRKKPCRQGLLRLRVSERLFDNDWRRDISYLSPFFRYSNSDRNSDPQMKEAWAVATWRAWWTQDVDVMGSTPNLATPIDYKVDASNRRPLAQTLMTTYPPEIREEFCDEEPEIVPQDRNQWAELLMSYGGREGQQDTHGDSLPRVIDVTTATGIAVLVHEKVSRVPNRMAALWYCTARFEELYAEQVRFIVADTNSLDVLFPSWSSWLKLALDIGTHLPRPVYLSDAHLEVFAGELASASVILVKYHLKYRELVWQIYHDGINARWTFGWSGLLACFSHLWTFERIYIAMLNGLSLLALSTSESVTGIDKNVRAMLYGYAAFEVSDRAVGRLIATDRKKELLKRYSQNKGKTCRGSGLCATRLACKALGLPQEASYMDGLPAFSTGWCSEFMENAPGSQLPRHGDNHDLVEAKEGSSNIWRYPHSHT